MRQHFRRLVKGGPYGLDSFDVTDRLTATAGARINVANIALQDRIGTALDGNDTFTRFTPLVGATYKLTPERDTEAA